MKVVLFCYEDIIQKANDSKIIISYDNNVFKNFLAHFNENRLKKIEVVSTDPSLYGENVESTGNLFTIKNFFDLDLENETALYICDKHNLLLDQLRYSDKKYNIDIIFLDFLLQYNEEKNTHSFNFELNNYKKGQNQHIPKTIHYFWIGGAPIPERHQKCIDSWKKFCPDYKIIEWNESNYDINKNKYMREAYEQKKWGFVPDYARLDIIYNYGGIYLDTDVEIVKSFDNLLYSEAFIGFESRFFVNAGSGFGAEKHNPVIKKMMEAYENVSFINPDGSLNMIASPKYQTDVLQKIGLKLNGQYQKLNGIEVFPANCFSPKSFYTGINWQDQNTLSVHHYDASWVKGKTHDESIKRHEEYENYLKGYELISQTDNEEDLISIIIPVYNVEKYLKKCLDSVLMQTYKNTQIILVDDGSTDCSGKICDEYAAENKNIICIHKKNGGLVSARKAGIASAVGKYTICIDSDDFIEKDMLSFLHKKAIENDADVVFSNMIIENEIYGTTSLMKSSIPIGVYDMRIYDNPVYKQFFVDDAGLGIMNGICSKLIRTDLYKKYQQMVPENIHCGEDAACIYPLLTAASVVSVTGGTFYHYIKRKDSILNKLHIDYMENWEKLFYFLKNNVHIKDDSINHLINQNLCVFINNRFIYGINRMLQTNNAMIVTSEKKIWSFPFDLVEKNSRVLIWGAGKVGKSFYKQLENSNYCICTAWCDTKKTDNPCVKTINEINENQFDCVVIAVASEYTATEITNILIEKFGSNIKKKIVWKKYTSYYI